MIDFLVDAEKLKPWRSVGQEFHSVCRSRRVVRAKRPGTCGVSVIKISRASEELLKKVGTARGIDFSISVVSPRRERMGELFDEPKKQAQVGGEAAYRS